MATTMSLIGRIDELDTISNPKDLIYYLDDVEQISSFTELKRMYEPLGLMPGSYMVTGIEGQYYNGYNDPDEAGWPLDVTESMSAFDIMVAVAASAANGYPNVNHVWFETLTIDVLARTLQFSMGS